MGSYLKKRRKKKKEEENKPRDCLLHSEDGAEFKTRKELFGETKFMRELLKSANSAYLKSKPPDRLVFSSQALCSVLTGKDLEGTREF